METPNRRHGSNQNAEAAGALFAAYANALEQADLKGQEAAALAIWQQLAAMKEDEPSPWLRAMGEAHQCEAVFDWAGAAAAYQRAIQAAANEPALQSSACQTLSALYDLLDQDALAAEAAQTATQAARRVTIPSLLALRLQAEAGFYLKAKDFRRTWATLNEAFAIIADEPRHELERALALILRADCLTEEGDFRNAEVALVSAWKLLQPHTEAFFAAGWQYALASWWATTARLRTRQNDLSAAVAAWREVVARHRIVAQLPQLEGPYKHNALAVALQNLGRALRQAGDNSAAASFAESSSIRRAIGLPTLEA